MLQALGSSCHSPPPYNLPHLPNGHDTSPSLPIIWSAMSTRSASPPPRATTPEPALQSLPSPRLRPTRSIGRLRPSTCTTSTLSSHDEFRLTFDEFGAGCRTLQLIIPACLTFIISSPESSKPLTSPGGRTRKRSAPTSPLLQNHHKTPRRSGSPPPPAHHHSTPPPPLPPLPSFLISVSRKSPSYDTPSLPSTPSTSSDESTNSRYYPIHRSN